MLIFKIAKRVFLRGRRKAKRKARRLLRRLVFSVVGIAGLFCAGYIAGMHKSVITAKLKGEEIPRSDKCWWKR